MSKAKKAPAKRSKPKPTVRYSYGEDIDNIGVCLADLESRVASLEQRWEDMGPTAVVEPDTATPDEPTPDHPAPPDEAV